MMKLSDLEGIGPVRLDALRAVGIISLRDLLFTLPVRYEDHFTVYPCNTKEPGNITVCGEFKENLKASYFHGVSRIQGAIHDQTGKLSVCWFNEPWMTQKISPGKEIRLYGRLTVKDGRRILQNPHIVDDSGWIPVYRAINHFPAKSFRKLIESALEHLEDCCPETLPGSFRLKNKLCELNFALRESHFPTSMRNLEIARRRLAFERIMIYLLYVSVSGKQRSNAFPMTVKKEWMDQYWSSFPYIPTKAQRKVMDEIAEDLRKPSAMARLVQGDVGSGKTAVALGAVFMSFSAGFQSAMMAPTEILAMQHYESGLKVLKAFGIRCRLLTGSTKAKERKEILEELKNGTCNVVFGTHALISRDVVYHRLGLVITDEQHRFGVNQRTALQKKGENKDVNPHVLVMSATPIPRSLALILYGDLDISVIDELPENRIPVKTRLVPEAKREDMYSYLKKEIQKGRQAYIVCPLVEDSENAEDLRSAKTVYQSLQNSCLSDLRIALTWGAQKSEEKELTISKFLAGEYDILVSTTVIEVGINNPNATVMIIENAERFGLSQLHQLRGRVGRGSNESWCFLLSDSSEKLNILCKTNDGFIISQKDLELRGPGDLIGTRQSGEAGSSMLFSGDSRLLEEVSSALRALRENNREKETLQALEKYATKYFEQNGHEIALN